MEAALGLAPGSLRLGEIRHDRGGEFTCTWGATKSAFDEAVRDIFRCRWFGSPGTPKSASSHIERFWGDSARGGDGERGCGACGGRARGGGARSGDFLNDVCHHYVTFVEPFPAVLAAGVVTVTSRGSGVSAGIRGVPARGGLGGLPAGDVSAPVRGGLRNARLRRVGSDGMHVSPGGAHSTGTCLRLRAGADGGCSFEEVRKAADFATARSLWI